MGQLGTAGEVKWNLLGPFCPLDFSLCFLPCNAVADSLSPGMLISRIAGCRSWLSRGGVMQFYENSAGVFSEFGQTLYVLTKQQLKMSWHCLHRLNTILNWEHFNFNSMSRLKIIVMIPSLSVNTN